MLHHIFSPGDPSAPVLLMLHGTGSSEEQIAPLGTTLDPHAGILAPRGPVVENGMSRWFRRHGEGVFDVDDVIARAGQLAEFVRSFDLGDRRVVAVGFSNGANIALATAMLHPDVLSEVVAFCGMYPFGDRDAEQDLSSSRLLVLNGDQDPMAPLMSADALVSTLTRLGADVERVVRPGGHGIEQSDVEAAQEWLSARELRSHADNLGLG